MLSDGVAFCRAGAGAPVVLLHGVGLRAECWLPQIRVLQRTHRVFAADLPGHGESACLSSSRPVLADFVDKIGAFVKSAVRSPAVFVGHSAGALLAFSLAARFPELCRGVAALNAVYRRCPAAREAVRARAKLLQKFAHLPKTESGKSGAGVELSPKCALNNANAESEYAANVETTLRRWFGENPAGCGEKTAAQCRLWLNSADCRGYAALYRVFAEEDGPEDGALSALRIPALFLTGAQDTNSTPEMALAMANDSAFGLAAGIFTQNLARAHYFSRAVRAGICWINTYRAISPLAPFGGYNMSGYGRESGHEAIADYTRTKTVWIETSGAPMADPFVMR